MKWLSLATRLTNLTPVLVLSCKFEPTCFLAFLPNTSANISIVPSSVTTASDRGSNKVMETAAERHFSVNSTLELATETIWTSESSALDTASKSVLLLHCTTLVIEAWCDLGAGIFTSCWDSCIL
ncbi:hypothetical protein OGAPHI_000341 [Ogataea philodendri]|uniref:Secreted protein n=1 Tax=Ogataea philodendri TaxID=1378263 RepID=A0A9P8PGR4_9ASCO|nr:uncharacterized protein OGAPHI_000341 [Ogataea philodendri]KAH3671636.1 hypothetical protein OGAPHI_000341 [Ogataea philodendri]